ncbi:MAG: phage tail protein [Candidatus Limnocylindrales bacterium]
MRGERPGYDLLPVIHRVRDAEQGYPLRALLEVVEEELRRLDEDIDGLYDNWFIETCEEWVVPYLGDLLGVQGLRPVPGGIASQRGLVANTIRYRRRKGTPAILEQLARDVTGWPARVVEYFQLLGTTQYLDHIRLSRARTVDLRDADRLELLETPFDTVAHTADVRHIDVGRGRYNIPDIGLHLWRLVAYTVADVDARAVNAATGRWTFDPAGRDLPPFNRPRTETEVTHLAEEVNVPGPLRRRALHAELTGGPPVFLAEPVPALRVRLDDPVPTDRLICCDLTDWHRPPGGPDDLTVAVDPVLGRLTLPVGMAPSRVRVDFAYGFPGDLGAGPYDRRATLDEALAVAGLPWPDRVDWQVGVGRDVDPVPGRIVRTISDALRLWDARTNLDPGQVGVIAVTDNATYDEDLSVVIPPGNRLLLVAASWPARDDPDHPGVPVRDPGTFVANGLRPHLNGAVQVTGAPGSDRANSELVVDGLSVEGCLTVRPGNLASLVVANTTVLTDRAATLVDGGWITASGNRHLTVRLLRSVCTGVRLADAPGLGLTDSIVHAGGDIGVTALAASAAQVEIEACTVLGRTVARSLAASNAILRGLVEVGHRQQGCVRFSYLPLESRAPRRYRCHPVDEVAARSVAPRFTSVRPADPGFGQLARDCPAELVTGAEDEGELGAYHFLQQHRRVANLLSQLDHYLRFGLEAGVFFAT